MSARRVHADLCGCGWNIVSCIGSAISLVPLVARDEGGLRRDDYTRDGEEADTHDTFGGEDYGRTG